MGQPDQRGKRLPVAEEPGFRDDHRFDKRLLLICRLLQAQPIVVKILGVDRDTALLQGTLDHGRADRFDIQADALLQKAEKPLLAHADTCPDCCGNSSSRTVSDSKSSTSIRCSRPLASWRTGPR
ncbi:hypothetical protein D3C73_969740 [compost metagenome]